MFAELTGFVTVASVSWNDAVLAVLTVLSGYVILGLTGFGSALIIVPLLAWNWPLSLVVPLALLIDVPALLLHTGLNLRQVAWREIPRLMPSMMIGAAVGVILLAHIGSVGPLLLLVLGLYIAVVGLRGLCAASRAPPVHAGWAWLAGLAMGLVESMFGTAGPVVVAWLSRRLPDPVILRATLPMTIMIVASLAIGGAAVSGQMKQLLLVPSWLLLQPVALAGVLLGHRIAARVPQVHMRSAVYSLLVLRGVATIGKSILSMLAIVG
jgi:uncharacterized protein